MTARTPGPEVHAVMDRAEALGASLTPQEAQIVELLERRGNTVSWACIIDALWDTHRYPTLERSHVSVLIGRLRRKGFTIKNRYGAGYYLVAWPASEASNAQATE